MEKKWKWLIPALLIVAVGALVIRGQTLVAELKEQLPAKLEQEIGMPVSIGRIEIASFHSLAVDDVAILDGSEAVLRSPRLEIELNLWPALRGKSPLSWIGRVTVLQPQAHLVQRPDGSWNIDRLLEQKRSGPEAFGGMIRLRQAAVRVEKNGQTWRLDDWNGTIDCAEFPIVQLELAGRLNDENASLNGRYNDSGRSGIELTVQKLNVAEYAAFCPAQYATELGGMIERVSVTLNGNKGRWTLAGEAELSEGRATAAGIVFNEATGRFVFTERSLYGVGSLKAQGQTLRVNAQADWSSGVAWLKGSVNAEQAELRKLCPESPVDGLIDAEIAVSGAYDQPLLSGTLRMAKGNYREYSFSDLKATGSFADGRLKISAAELKAFDGLLEASGDVELQKKRYHAVLTAKNVSLQPLANTVVGRWQGSVELNGDSFEACPKLHGTLAMGAGTLNGIAVDGVQANVHGSDGEVVLDGLTAQFGEGSVSGQGKLSAAGMDLAVHAAKLPIERLGIGVSGRGVFSGRLTGPYDGWQLNGEAALEDGVAFAQPYTVATGQLRLDKRGVKLDEWRMQSGEAEHRLNGRIGYAADDPFELTIRSRKARAETIVQLLLPGEQLTGNVDNDITLSGSRNNLQGKGHVRLTDGSFRERLVARAEGDYRIAGQELYLDGIEIDSLNTRIQLSGKAARDSGLELAVRIDNLDFARLPFQYPYPVNGIGRFTGTLSGTADRPVFAGEFFAERLQLDKETIKAIHGKLRFADNALDISESSFAQADGTGSFAGGIDFNDNNAYGTLQLSNLTLERMLPILGLPDRGIRGKMSGEVRLAGKARHPDVWVDAHLIDGSVRNYPLNRVDMDLAFENNVLKVKQLSAQQGAHGKLMAQGTAALDGPLELEVDGQDIDAGLITALTGADWTLAGTLRFAAQISGTTREPQAAASVEINNGGVKTATFDSLYGLLILEKGNVQVNQLLLRKGDYRASAYGNVPLSALQPTERRTNLDAQMDLRCRLDNANLSILPLLAPKLVEWGDGVTQGEIAVSGTLEHPLLNGAITVNGGRLKLSGVKEPLENIMLELAFAEDTLNVNRCDAKMGTGGLSLGGLLRWQDLKKIEYDLALKLDSPLIHHRYFNGPIRGALTLKPGADQHPLLAGDLIFERDTLMPPVILPEFGATEMDLGLDVNVIIGNRVRAYNSMFYDLQGRGRVHFGGTLKNPNSSGRIRVLNGTLNYLSTSFKIFEGVADFNRTNAFEPTVHLSAQAKLPQLAVDLNVNGPVSALDFSLTSEPTLSQQQIIAVLNAGGRVGDARDRNGFDEVSSLLNAGLQAKFLGQLEGNVRNLFGLDQFRLNKSAKGEILHKSYFEKEGTMTENREVYNLQLGKYVNDRLFVSYNFAIGYQAYEAALRYDLSRRISLVAATDEQRHKWIGFEARFKF